MNITIYKPLLDKYKKSAYEAIESEWISNHGEFIQLATDKLKEIINAKHVILMSNGTVATHCLFISLKYKYPHVEKIYVPNNCYVAAYNCALMEYDIENLEMMKINENTWNMCDDEEYLLSLEPNSAIMIVHNLGGIIDVDRIKKIRPDIILVEDNCEGLFGKYNGKYTGTSNSLLCSSVSFYGNKSITTGEGGAFITNNDDIYNYIKKVYSQGMSSVRYIHDVLAYNYRMTNIQAAFLYDQLNDIDHILNLKTQVFKNYIELLHNEIENGKISLQLVPNNCERANWMFAIKFNNNNKTINEVYNYFLEKGIETRPFFYTHNNHNHLKNIKCDCDLTINEKLNASIVMFPSFPVLTIDEQIYIVEHIREFIYLTR